MMERLPNFSCIGGQYVAAGKAVVSMRDRTYRVAGHLPAALGDELRNTLVDVGAGGDNVVLVYKLARVYSRKASS